MSDTRERKERRMLYASLVVQRETGRKKRRYRKRAMFVRPKEKAKSKKRGRLWSDEANITQDAEDYKNK
ncbi:hypothetical protein BDV97DRAFT_107970 [Delphinella strobiligena]|nr:hypothetical protein BDV97DRAFT_107970 [Delphinella strobiligena]